MPSRLGLGTKRKQRTRAKGKMFHHLSSARALVVHLHALDSHSPVVWLAPGRLPKCSGIPELFRTSKTAITPGLVAHTILPEAVRATNSYVEDEVELLIEWRVPHSGLGPSIKQSGFVGLVLAEMPAVPHVSWPGGELDEEHLL
jgi:hypothetical protein